VGFKDRLSKLKVKQRADSAAKRQPKAETEEDVHRPKKKPDTSMSPTANILTHRPTVVESVAPTTVEKFLKNVYVFSKDKEVTKAGVVILRNAVLIGCNTGLDDRLFRFGCPLACQPVFARIILNPEMGTVECWSHHNDERPRLTIKGALVADA